MANPSLSWIEPAAWARLLEDAGLVPVTAARAQPPPDLAPRLSTTGAAPTTPGPALAPAAEAPRGAPPSARVPASDAPTARPGAAFTPPLGPLDARLAALVDWVERETGAQHVFVADEDGLPLAASDDAVDPAAIAAELLRLLRTVRLSVGLAVDGTISLSLDAERSLQLIEATAAGRRFGLGVVGRAELGRGLMRRIGEGLYTAFGVEGERHG